MPRAWTHDEWYALIEQLTGLREDTPSRNPGCIREIRTMALELSEHPNPFDTIEALRSRVEELEAETSDLTEKATHAPRPKQRKARTQRPA